MTESSHDKGALWASFIRVLILITSPKPHFLIPSTADSISTYELGRGGVGYKPSVYGNILATQNVVCRPTIVSSLVGSLDVEALRPHPHLLNPVYMLARSAGDLYTVWETLACYRN